MPAKKSFPLRINADIYRAIEAWANDELRSVNGHIEFLLREAKISAPYKSSSLVVMPGVSASTIFLRVIAQILPISCMAESSSAVLIIIVPPNKT